MLKQTLASLTTLGSHWAHCFRSSRPAHLGRCAADLKADASAAGPLYGGLGGWVIGCLGVRGLSGRGLGDPFLSKMGVWRTLGGDMGDLEGPGGTQGSKVSILGPILGHF